MIFYLIIIIIIATVVIYYITKKDSSPIKKEVLWVISGDDYTGNGSIIYSFDGKSWQISTGASFSDRGNGIAYGNQLWVAIGANDFSTGNILYSNDGISWQESTGKGFASYGQGVAYGTSNGTSPLWVAVGNDDGANPGNGNILYSNDGISWQESIGLSFNNIGFGVAYGTSDGTSPLWVAVGNDDGAGGRANIMYSVNGKEWTESIGSSFATQGFGVAYGTSNGTSPLWVATGDDGIGAPRRGNIMYSVNGKEWEESIGMSFNYSGIAVAYGTSNGTSSLWVAVGNDSLSGPGKILYSENGKEWQLSSGASFFNQGNAVAYGRDNYNKPLWIATGLSGEIGPGQALFSYNGKDWQEIEEYDIHFNIGYGVAYKSILPNVPNFY